ARAGRPAVDVELIISVDGRQFGVEGAPRPAVPARPAALRTHEPRPRDRARGTESALRYRLEGPVLGRAKKLADAAASHMADPESPRTFSPLFIHGTCGLGKTHLLQGIAQAYREARPRANVKYMTAEAFTNDYVAALRNNRLDAFRKSYRSVELLCLDD